MKVNIKTIWGAGIVSVAEKYVKEALDKKEGLEIECKGANALVSYEKLLTKTPRKAKFDDKFGRKDYTLYDFFWNDIKK